MHKKPRGRINSFARYTSAVFATVLVVLLVWVALVSLIDPYGLVGTPATRYTAIKPSQREFARIFKPIDALRRPYDGIILGASPELVGLDPNDPALIDAGYHLYNLALVGERPYEMAELAQLAFKSRDIKLVVIGLEFQFYNVSPSASGDLRPYYPDTHIFWWALGHAAKLMVSLDGAVDSYNTIKANIVGPHPPTLLPGGRLSFIGDNPSADFDYVGRFQGQLADYDENLFPTIARFVPDWLEHGFDHRALRSVIDLAASHGARVVIFIDPNHALEMELLHHAGLWPAFERWKRELTCVVDEEKTANPGSDLSLWDFSGYTPVTTEPLLDRDGRALDYWDPQHFGTRLGHRVIAAMIGQEKDRPASAATGVPIDPENIEKHLWDIRAAAAAYRLQRADDVAWLTSIVGEPAKAGAPILAQTDIPETPAVNCLKLLGSK
jgi:hypothetical protein